MALSSEDLLVLLVCMEEEERWSWRIRKGFGWEKFRPTKEKGEFNNLVREMRLHDHEFFFNMFPMSPTQLEELTKLVAPLIRKDSSRREAIAPQESVYQVSKLWVNTISWMRICVINCTLIGRDFFSLAKFEKSWTHFNFSAKSNSFAENWRNVTAHEQNIFREKFFSFRKVFSQWRSGFRKEHSTNKNLTSFVISWHHFVNLRESIGSDKLCWC